MSPIITLCLLLASITELSGHIALVFPDEAGVRQVGLLRLDDDHFTALQSSPVLGAPRWSPDGNRLAFPVERSPGQGGIAVQDIDAAQQPGAYRELPHARPRNILPRWHPQGNALAYQSSERHGEDAQIRVYHLEEDTETVWADGQIGLMRPVWLPSLDLMLLLDPNQELAIPGVDAERFLAEAEAHGAIICIGHTEVGGQLRTEIFVITVTQSLKVLPIIQRQSQRYVEWAVESGRRGRYIAFESNDGGDREIFVLGRRGILNVSNHRAADWNPVWSPRQDLLLFESFRSGRRGIYRVHPETAHVQPIAANAEADFWAPAWSPDGRHVAYVGNPDGAPSLYVSDTNGGAPLQSLAAPTPAYAPAWRPHGH